MAKRRIKNGAIRCESCRYKKGHSCKPSLCGYISSQCLPYTHFVIRLSQQGQYRRLLLPSHLRLLPFHSPPHENTASEKQRRINSTPRKQYPKIQPQRVVRPKQQGPTRIHDLIQRPRIFSLEEARRQRDGIEARAGVRDGPEYQPKRCPRLPDHHGDVLKCEAQRYHADEGQHPVYREGAVAE